MRTQRIPRGERRPHVGRPVIGLKWVWDHTAGPVLGWFVDEFLYGFIFKIPYIGPALKEIFHVAEEAVYFVVSIPDIVLGFIGILPKKDLRLVVRIKRDSDGQPNAELETVTEWIRFMVEAFWHTSNVRVRPGTAPVVPEGASVHPDLEDYLDYIVIDDFSSEWTTASGGVDAWGEDLAGGQWQSEVEAASASSLRGLTGYGVAIVAVSVGEFKSGINGCSLGPLTNYVTVHFDAANDSTGSVLAHESGHACNLLHWDDAENLMHPKVPHRAHLNRLQVAVLRASRHVTYF